MNIGNSNVGVVDGPHAGAISCFRRCMDKVGPALEGYGIRCPSGLFVFENNRPPVLGPRPRLSSP